MYDQAKKELSLINFTLMLKCFCPGDMLLLIKEHVIVWLWLSLIFPQATQSDSAHTLLKTFLPFLGSNFHLKPFHFQDFKINSPYSLQFLIMQILKTLLPNLSRFLGLSRTCIPFHELYSPGKCPNKILGLYRFLSTHTNSVTSTERQCLYVGFVSTGF